MSDPAWSAIPRFRRRLYCQVEERRRHPATDQALCLPLQRARWKTQVALDYGRESLA